MKMESLLEIYRQKKTQNKPLFQHVVLPDNITFMSGYESMYVEMDKAIVTKYSDYFFINPLGVDNIENFDSLWAGFLYMHYSDYQKMYDALLKEYNPIENYDKHSLIKTTYEGTESNTHTKEGSESTTITKEGTESTELEYSGKETNKHTTPDAGYTDTVENMISPEDTSTYIGTEKTQTVTAHREDTDTTEFTQRKDTSTTEYADRVDTSTTEYTDRADKDIKEFTDRIDIVDEYTHGQIGVTKNTELISDELQLRLSSSFYPLIFGKFIREYAIV